MSAKAMRRWVFLVLFVLGTVPGRCLASQDQAKMYKNVFGGDKPKCVHCHVDKIPKKEEGKHELNAYGQKVKHAKTGELPDEETYKAVGKE